MYKIGHKKRSYRHSFFIIVILVLITSFLGVIGYLYITKFQVESDVSQAKVSTVKFDPNDSKHNLKIDHTLYTMELPPGWKQIADNPDTRYASTRWQNENRILELFTDKIPPDVPFNKIMSVTIDRNMLSIGSMSDNCSRFTSKISESNLKVPSKWDNAPFLCDLSNWSDNIVGVSDKTTGTTLKFTGQIKGLHEYMFMYTDRGIPEDPSSLVTALTSFHPK